MLKFKKLIRQLQNKTEFEKLLLKIKESLKAKPPKKAQLIIIKDSLLGLDEQITNKDAFKLLHYLFQNCPNYIGAYKMILIIEALQYEIPEFSHNFELESLFKNIGIKSQLNTQREIENNLIAIFLKYLKQHMTSFQFYKQAYSFTVEEQYDVFEQSFSHLMAMSLIFINQLKIIKSLQSNLEFVLTKRYSLLIDQFSLLIMHHSVILYNFVSEFVKRYENEILINQDENQAQMIYQVYQDVIHTTAWITKLLKLSNLTKTGLNFFVKLYQVNVDQNRKYELHMQSRKIQYDYPTPVPSPLIEAHKFKAKAQKSASLKQNELQTREAQSDRPLSYNKFSD